MDWTSAVPEPKTDQDGKALCSFCKAPAIASAVWDCDGCQPFAQASQGLADQAAAAIIRIEAAAQAFIDSVVDRGPTEQERAQLLEMLEPLAGHRKDLSRQAHRVQQHSGPHNHPVFTCRKHFEKAGLPPADECDLDEVIQ